MLSLSGFDLLGILLVFLLHAGAGVSCSRRVHAASLLLTALPAIPMAMMAHAIFDLWEQGMLWSIDWTPPSVCGVFKAHPLAADFLPPCALVVFMPLYNLSAAVLIVFLWRRGTRGSLILSQLIFGGHVAARYAVFYALTSFAHAGYMPY